eukprot:5855182-Amphidinium_carterae.2
MILSVINLIIHEEACMKGDVGRTDARQDEAEITLSAYADSDWGTCKESRRSCSGGVDGHTNRHSEATRCIALRAGVIRGLHCQQAFEDGLARLQVAGVANPANLFTKPVSVEVMHCLLPLLELERVGLGESENKGERKAPEAE